MKKIYVLLFTFLMTAASFGQDLVITGIIDGPLPGGLPKGLELYVVNDIADLSVYGLERAGNGGSSTGAQTYTFPADAKTAGEYIYLGTETPLFNQYLGINPTYEVTTGELNNNGDDTVILYSNGAISDLIGEIGVDGSGTAWEYLDGWAYRNDGFGPNATFTSSEWTFSGANALDGCDLADDTGINADCGSVYPLGTYNPVGSTDPSITITSPSEGTVFPPGTTSVNLSIFVQNFVVDAVNDGNDGHIHWTVNAAAQPMKYDVLDETINVTDGGTYTVFMKLVDDNHQDIAPAVNATVNFSVNSAVQVADLAALRADVIANGEGGIYELMSVPTVTYARTSRNQKYVQDSSGAGILIDDSAGTITTTFAIGDGISGLIGQTSSFGSVLQFIPSVDASVVAGASVTPEVVDIATLLTNWEDYESELVKINSVTFADAGGTFASSTVYNISDPDMMAFRTNFSEADYIGQTIPAGANAMVVLVAEFNGTPQVVARSLSDLTLSVESFETNNFNVYPNPVSNGIVNITSRSNDAISITVFDILGKQVITETVSDSSLNVSSLNTGIYIMKITQNGNYITKKLVVR